MKLILDPDKWIVPRQSHDYNLAVVNPYQATVLVGDIAIGNLFSCRKKSAFIRLSSVLRLLTDIYSYYFLADIFLFPRKTSNCCWFFYFLLFNFNIAFAWLPSRSEWRLTDHFVLYGPISRTWFVKIIFNRRIGYNSFTPHS